LNVEKDRHLWRLIRSDPSRSFDFAPKRGDLETVIFVPAAMSPFKKARGGNQRYSIKDVYGDRR
jgi:hypothetical protein